MVSLFIISAVSLPEQKKIEIVWGSDLPEDHVFKEQKLTVTFDNDIDYHADIASFTFLSVIVPCYYHTLDDKEIHVGIPSNAAMDPCLLLRDYQDMKGVTFSQTQCRVDTSYAKKTSAPVPYGICYGGGKDSLLSTAIHGDVYGEEHIELLRLVWDVSEANLESKRKIIKSSMDFMKDRGFGVNYIESNFHSIVASRDIGKIPNFSLYPGLMLPLISARGYEQIAHGYDIGHFHDPVTEKRAVPFKLVRPEHLKVLAESISLCLGREITFKNFNYGFNAGTAFEFIAKGYPDYVSNIYMCERLGSKWCIKCRKCFLYALSCLAFKCDSEFNIAYFFQNSVYVKELMKEIKAIGKPDRMVYVTRFAYPTHICSTVQLLANVDEDHIQEIFRHKKYPDALPNFNILRDFFADFSFPDYDCFWLQAYREDAAILNNDKDGKVERYLLNKLMESGVKVSHKSCFEGYNRGQKVTYNFNNLH